MALKQLNAIKNHDIRHMGENIRYINFCSVASFSHVICRQATHVLTPGKKIPSKLASNNLALQSLRMMLFPCTVPSISRILIVLVFLFPFTLSANTCFGANDGYSGIDPVQAANSKLGKAV
jgi:hypothetical protein